MRFLAWRIKFPLSYLPVFTVTATQTRYFLWGHRLIWKCDNLMRHLENYSEKNITRTVKLVTMFLSGVLFYPVTNNLYVGMPLQSRRQIELLLSVCPSVSKSIRPYIRNISIVFAVTALTSLEWFYSAFHNIRRITYKWS